MNEHRISLDLSKEPLVAPVLYLGQGDKLGTTLIVSIYDDGQVPTFESGSTVTLCMKNPGENGGYYEVAGTLEGNEATFLIDEEYAASTSGVSDIAYVEVSTSFNTTSTSRFTYVVFPSAEHGADPSSTYSNGINEAIERANDAAEAAEGVVLQDVPLMSPTVRGGAQLGDGLEITDGVLSVDPTALVTQAEKGAANGVAELDQNGLVLSSQLPSYVDDVLEYASTSQFPATGESGKIYVAVNTNLTYRWTGSAYTEISPSLALGETSSTAYRGDRGAAAYAHAVTNKGAAFSSNLYKITTNSEGHVTAATPATSADIVAFLNNQAITPASVTASGTIQGGTISDGVGTLAQLRDSVSLKTGVAKIEFYSLSQNLFSIAVYRGDGVALLFEASNVAISFYKSVDGGSTWDKQWAK